MRHTSDDRIRKEIAYEAAKLVAVDGLDDFLQAKRKAAQHLGINNKRMLPSNNEIESALIEYQSLYLNKEQTQTLCDLRLVAYKAMTLLEQFNPRLTGSVLSGTASQHSEITLHVYSDTSETVTLFLESKKIPVTICERRVLVENNNAKYFTALKFIAGELDIIVIVLPLTFLKNAPIDSITERPMKRANLNDVKKLIKP